ncbi:hypothetical protein [Curtobacterium sp. MCBD17_003]|uniref:hypothetical protein n=1 Tax=Curtobacterium sp. MCBD17_003 TaxID=2175667 RepID=UPI0011B5F852|nr:hypothetical protein [Curtobacterium sp. MCBD17_003]WIE56292.1 hypothetical protein DEI88_016230 [Curtobacterium sp. MCBD17_003]
MNVLDGALGGHNALNVIQNSLAMIAIWLLARAATRDQDLPRVAKSPLLLIGMLAAIALPFFLINRSERTSQYFIDDNIGQVALYLYASIYMLSVAAICGLALMRQHQGRSAAQRTLRVGLVLIVAASLVEVALLSVEHALRLPATTNISLEEAFDGLFYPGVMCGVLGLASIAIGNWRQSSALARLTPKLQTIAEARGVAARPAPGGSRRAAYNLLIALSDYQALGGELTEDDRGALRATERALSPRLSQGPSGPVLPFVRRHARS